MLIPNQIHSPCDAHSWTSPRGKRRLQHTLLLPVPQIMLCAALCACGEDLTSPAVVAIPFRPVPFIPSSITLPGASLTAAAEDRDAPHLPDRIWRSGRLVGTYPAPVR
jgi:hypothetical protein